MLQVAVQQRLVPADLRAAQQQHRRVQEGGAFELRGSPTVLCRCCLFSAGPGRESLARMESPVLVTCLLPSSSQRRRTRLAAAPPPLRPPRSAAPAAPRSPSRGASSPTARQPSRCVWRCVGTLRWCLAPVCVVPRHGVGAAGTCRLPIQLPNLPSACPPSRPPCSALRRLAATATPSSSRRTMQKVGWAQRCRAAAAAWQAVRCLRCVASASLAHPSLCLTPAPPTFFPHPPTFSQGAAARRPRPSQW